jgi:hypothetical protein
MSPLWTRKHGQAQASYGACDGLRCHWKSIFCIMLKLDPIGDMKTPESRIKKK